MSNSREQLLPWLIERLQLLVETPSPTGFTHKVEAVLLQELKDLGLEPWQASKGTVFCRLNPEAEGDGILLSAHIDTLGLMVRSVKSNGRLRATLLGGFPLQYVEQENVTVWTRDGQAYEGTFRMNDPAAHGRRDLGTAERSDSSMEIVLDQRTASKDETTALGIQAGDPVSLDPRFRLAGDGYIKSRHLDDKASSAVLLSLAKRFAAGNLTCSRPVTIMFTRYEEVGHGAAAGHPEGITDMIAVDMGVVADDLETDEHKVSICAKDSGGPYNYELTTELINIAKAEKLNYAVDVYPFYGSDAGAALAAGHDYRHALIGPGVAASHGYERTHEDGLWNTFRLLEGYLKKA